MNHHANRPLLLIFGLTLIITAACEDPATGRRGTSAGDASRLPMNAEDITTSQGASDASAKETTDPRSLDLSLSEFITNTIPLSDECCTDPGEISNCWWQDAERDGITCSAQNPCPSGRTCNYSDTSSSGQGLCECASNSDCYNGNDLQGVCTGAGVCGPSFCNGYLVCSCWGGCQPSIIADYQTPKDMCQDRNAGYAGYCCEGAYPESSDGQGLGFCANTGSCVTGDDDCVRDADCEDGNPCTDDVCRNGFCIFEVISNDVPEIQGCGLIGADQSTDCAREWCIAGSCTIDFINEDSDCTDNPQNIGAGWYGIEPRADDLDVTSCYYQKCDNAGRCQGREDLANSLVCGADDGSPCTDPYCAAGSCHQDPDDHVGQMCNSDDNACTLDVCDSNGLCASGGLKDCDDGNWCTFPDGCEDNDPSHITWSCVNPPVTGPSEDFGFVDTLDCLDMACVNGVEDYTATDCSGFNPLGYNLECNTYECVDGLGEDNCSHTYLDQIGNFCSDSNICILTYTCQDVGGYNDCVEGPPVDCNDNNECTDDWCDVGGGVCVNDIQAGRLCNADGDPCTVDDECDALGVCNPGLPLNCWPYFTECSNGVCNPAYAECEYDYFPEGTPCNADNNACTINDTCNATGGCIADPVLKDCSGMDGVCSTGVCDPVTGLCYRDGTAQEGLPCDADGDACTPNDTCQGGFCVADDRVDCSALEDQCNGTVCNPATGVCEYDNIFLVDTPCNRDNDGCTADTCQGPASGDERLFCLQESVHDCSDGNACTEDICQSTAWNAYLCQNPDEPLGSICDHDDNGCTQPDICDGNGVCLIGDPVTPEDCEDILGLDTDCNTGLCVNEGGINYHCLAVLLETDPGDCNQDGDGCTLDECVDTGDPSVGAECQLGDARDCDSLIDPPCVSGQCAATDAYASACEPVYEDPSVLCNDNDGCTESDHCDVGGCDGTPVVCTPSDVCHTATCTSTGDASHVCTETAIAGCCIDAADCTGASLPCESTPAPPDGCSQLACVANACICQDEPDGSGCTDFDHLKSPDNNYSGTCNAGVCEESPHLPDNNLCSDLFDTADATQLDTTHIGYLGAIPTDGTSLAVTGSTILGENNYQSVAEQCDEAASSNYLGEIGGDVVYAVEYATNGASDYQLYDYVIKVEANFEVGVFVAQDIDEADECPEGNNPGMDTHAETFEDVMSEVCAFPYQNVPDKPVLEEKCDIDTYLVNNQDCCDPCIDGDECGFKWCKLGYKNNGDPCDMCLGAGGAGYEPWTHLGDCDALWLYPKMPYDCDSVTPGDEAYDNFDYMALTVVHPTGITDGSSNKLLIFIDGVGGATGNFYLTVERKPHEAGPCSRTNDDTRVYDLTDVDPAGETFLGTFEGAVNGEPAPGGACGGHDCYTLPAETGCHEGGFSANEFWPNKVYFKIFRDPGAGIGTYCIESDESIADSANLVLSAWRRDDPLATTLCDEPFTYVQCRNDDVGGDIRVDFPASPGQLYIFELSQWDHITRPCTDAETDNCKYQLTVRQGACP